MQKSSGMVVHANNPSIQDGDKCILKTDWPTHLAQTLSSWFSEKPCFKAMSQRMTSHCMSFSGISKYMQIHWVSALLYLCVCSTHTHKCKF